MYGTVCNYTLIHAHLNGIYQVWGVTATMNGIVYRPSWTFRPSCYARRLPIDTCLVSKKFYKSPLTNYVFVVAMGGLLLKLPNFKKVKLILGHPVLHTKLSWPCRVLILCTSNSCIYEYKCFMYSTVTYKGGSILVLFSMFQNASEKAASNFSVTSQTVQVHGAVTSIYQIIL